MDDCRDLLFPCQFILKISKRLKSQEDRNKLIELKTDVFTESMPIKAICKKHNIKTIKHLDSVTTTSNISYFKFYADKINKVIHSKYGKNISSAISIDGNKYYPGLELVCKKHYKNNSVRLFVNYTYEIKSITKNSFTVHEPVEGLDIPRSFQTSELTKYFKLAYANTCHSVQGMSIDNKITIFNANIESHADRNFFWTALTRATNFNNVTVFIHSDEEVVKLGYSRLLRYFKDKVDGYKHQDENKNRDITKGYITGDWILEQYKANDSCVHCQSPFDIDFDEDHNMTSNLTVDRIDNSKAHTKANCCLSCLHCNVSKH
jgi:hypothetical protein